MHPPDPASRTFGDDVAFLRRHADVEVLSDGAAALAVVPAWQGRVATSTAAGPDAEGFGFLNDARIASDRADPQINVFGGEDRCWIGPEGSRFSLYFDVGAPMTFPQWRVPRCIDLDPWAVVARGPRSISFRHEAVLTNRAGSRFALRFDRDIALLSRAEAAARFGGGGAGTDLVAYETRNALTNIGDAAWTRESGAPSLWIIGMYKAAPRTTAIVPLRRGAAAELGPAVVDDYFGRVPADRLRVADDAAYFNADGRLRSKIGVPPRRSLGRAGAFDPDRGALTLVAYAPPAGDPPYVNSLWTPDVDPYSGDAINAYNDGPNESGAQFGAFYELETSSPALFLAPGASATHVHATAHATGSRDAVRAFARAALGVEV
jgi:hypothetical protein